jgi:ABC-type sugar transport system substrate-binding protein
MISLELGVSRRKLMQQLGAAGLAGGLTALAGCSSLRSENDGDAQAAQSGGNGGGGSQELPPATRVPLVPPPTADSMDFSNPTHEEREMVFVTHDANEFFVPAIVGMNDGLQRNGWTGEFMGPSSGHDSEQQIETLNTIVNRLEGGRDVLATTVLDENQYEGPVKAAAEKNIPVVQYNTTVDAWDFNYMMENFGNVFPYVGQKFIPGGVAVGETGYEKAQEKLGTDELTLLPTNGVPGHPALEKRTEGFRMAFEAQENTTVLDTLNVSDDLGQAITRVQDAYRANDNIDVILGAGWWGSAAAARLIEENGLENELVAGGFDLPEATLEGIRNGYIDFTAGQDPYSQGYLPTQLAWEYMERGVPMKDYNTGISIIDESNIEFATRRSGSWDELRSWQDENYSV